MRKSNKYAVEHLLENGFDHIWLKSHTRFNDYVYCKDQTYEAKDIWNLFDGICIKDGCLYFIQVKTNTWAPQEPILKFIEKVDKMRALSINVHKKKGRWYVKHIELPIVS